MKRTVFFLVSMVAAVMIGGGDARADSQIDCISGDCIEFGIQKTEFDTLLVTEVICNVGGCDTDGWITRLPSGEVTETSCLGNGCFVDGYQVKNSDGKLQTVVRCLPQGCHIEGWRTSGPSSGPKVEIADGWSSGDGTALHLCKSSDCANGGWTVMVNGEKVAEAFCKDSDPDSCFTKGWLQGLRP